MFTIQQLIDRYTGRLTEIRNTIAPRLAERETHTASIATIRDAVATANRAMNDDEQRQVNEADAARRAIDTETASQRAEIDQLEAQIADLRRELAADEAATRAAGTGNATGAPPAADRAPTTVGREERTYTADKSARGEASFFADAYGAQFGNVGARERLERNLREAQVERELTERATSTSSFAGLVVPQYLVDAAALLARSGRPFANTVVHQPLPSQGMQLIVPRGTTGAAAAIQTNENTSVQNTDEVWANLTVPVATIAGQQDVSRQSLERGTPGIDELIYMDLSGAYAVALDQQCLSGTGTSGQMLGVFNTPGINQATAFGAAVTPATYYSKVAGQINAVETTRFLAPTAILMHPRRWNWLVSQVDSSNRPLVTPNDQGPFNALGIYDSPQDTPSSSPVGKFLGLGAITDASTPTGVGSGPEDQTLVYRREDAMLWEDGDGMPRQLRFEQTLGNALTVKLVAYGYAAFTAGRYPAAFGVVGGNATAGNGTVAPTF